VGQNEAEDGNAASIRSRFLGDEGTRNLDEFIADVQKEIAEKTIRPNAPQDDKDKQGKQGKQGKKNK
ncbi:MAG: hypothetical protein KBS83_05500, partial [Lachnospiraceae bacterium]|nr:hypothetical protein [Candidatus Equihabitans merdae]